MCDKREVKQVGKVEWKQSNEQRTGAKSLFYEGESWFQY